MTNRVKYDGEGNKILEIDPLGRETRHRYDELNRLLETVGPEWAPGSPHTTQFVYDGNDNLIQTTLLNDPVDQVRTRTYDPLNRLKTETDALGNTRSFQYDAVGNLVREIDARLNARSYVYDARNRLVSSTVHLTRVSEPSRRVVTTYAYDKVGNRTEEHWPNGNDVVHAYDALNRLTATVDSLGPVSTSTYDARGNVIEATDGNANLTANTYDALNRLIAQELPEQRSLSFAYDVAGNKISETNARGHTTTYGYDTLNRLVEIIDPEPFLYKESYSYDAVGNQLTETDRRGNTTSFEYDALNRLVRRVDPPPQAADDPLEVSYGYDAAGNRLTELDRRGNLSEFSYDAENRRTHVVRAALGIEEVGYDANGNVVSRRDANGNVTTYEYDERDLLLAENRPLAAITRYTLDDMGDRVAARDPEGRITAWSYDLRRRMATETRAATSVEPETTTFAYDGNGNRISRLRPEGGEWTYGHDGADRLVAVTDPEENGTVYAYDKNGNLLTQTDANTNPTAFDYDELDRQIRKTYADGAFEETGYDPNGNVTHRQDAKGQLTVFAYDALNRQVLATYPEDPGAVDDLQAIARVYDANNNVVEVRETYAQSGDQVTSRTYDVFDRLETVTDRWSNLLRYAYDANGNRTQLTDPAGEVTTYSYDALNRMSAVVTGAGITEYAYYRDSRLKGIAYPNGTTASYNYDDSGRVQTIDNRHTGTLVSSFAYTYDRNGNRDEQIETHTGQVSETTTYAYDKADRLIEVGYPEKTTAYTYDAVGNRLTEVDHDLSDVLISDKSYTYNPRSQLEQLVDHLDPSRSVTYGYDANGNQISRTQGSGGATDFTFDVLDRLIRVEQDGLPIGTYRYDSQGLRVEKLTAEGPARYVYDDQSVLTQVEADGTTKYEYGPDRLLSVDDPIEGKAFYLLDALGSVVNLTTNQGTLLGRYQWDAWGNLRASIDTEASQFGFTGHEHDIETGLVYTRARFYDPEIGLFISEDPAEGDISSPPSLHRYLYAFQNPTIYIDPDGRQSEKKENERTPTFLLRQRILSPGEEAPPGWRVESLGADLRVAIPPGYRPPERLRVEEEKLPGTETEEDSLPWWKWESLKKRYTNTIEALKEFGRAFDEAVSKRRDEDQVLAAKNMEEQIAATGQTIEKFNDVGVAVVEDAVNISSDLSIAGGTRNLVRRGLRKPPKPTKPPRSGGSTASGGSAASEGSAAGAAPVPRAAGLAEDVLPTPQVSDPKLQNIIKDLYKGTTNPSRVGTGTTADAVRNELLTGQPTAGRFHIRKAEDYSRALQNWLSRNPDAAYSDRLVAQSLLDDLQAALETVP